MNTFSPKHLGYAVPRKNCGFFYQPIFLDSYVWRINEHFGRSSDALTFCMHNL